MMTNLQHNIAALSSEEKQSAIMQLTAIAREIETYRSAYWWTPAPCASQRRAREFKRTVEVHLGHDVITFASAYQESCQHCYYRRKLQRNGRDINVTTIKNNIKQLEMVSA